MNLLLFRAKQKCNNRQSCRSPKMRGNEKVVAKITFGTAENEPRQVCNRLGMASPDLRTFPSLAHTNHNSCHLRDWIGESSTTQTTHDTELKRSRSSQMFASFLWFVQILRNFGNNRLKSHMFCRTFHGIQAWIVVNPRWLPEACLLAEISR